MKKLLTLFLIVFFSFVSAQSVFARSGCCSWHGGESYCDYSTNRWVCNDGTYSPTCTCDGGSYYQPPSYQTPTCPLNSYWTGSSCSCYSGYVSSGGSCISVQQYCWNTLGLMSQYNYGTNKCECSYGYVYSGGTCISGSSYCQNTYGFNTRYNSLTNKCDCNYGYVWDSGGNKCISEDESCQNQLGLMSRYNSLSNTCDCLAGFTIQGEQCLPEQKPVFVPHAQIYYPTPTSTVTVLLAVEGASTTDVSNTPTPTIVLEHLTIPPHKILSFWEWLLSLIGIK